MKRIIWFWVLGVITTILAPLIFTQEWADISFIDTGQIGDTIGGTTAPIIGIFSILLLVFTLQEQIKFNKEQKRISTEEQFKSTFFNLLQTQRDILEKISGEFSYLGNTIDKENYKVFKGLDFFKVSRYQLSQIFKSLNNNTFHNNYIKEDAYSAEEYIDHEYELNYGMPEELEKVYKEMILNIREPFLYAYINDKYKIKETTYNKYKSLNDSKKTALVYIIFYNRYEGVGYYFRHIYQILKFIYKNEQETIASFGNNPNEEDKEKIRKHFKQYTDFIQSQMSNEELLMLFYNSFAFEKAQKLIIHYELLENLSIQNLISKEHNCIPELKLKNKKEWMIDVLK